MSWVRLANLGFLVFVLFFKDSKKGDWDHKMKWNELKQIIWHDLPQKDKYLIIKLFGFDFRGALQD